MKDDETFRVPLDRCGWRSLVQIAEGIGSAPNTLYGKRPGRVIPELQDLISEGLVEVRYFEGERGRGGEIMRLRISDPRKTQRKQLQGFDQELVLQTEMIHEPKTDEEKRRYPHPEKISPLESVVQLNAKRIAVLPFVSMSFDPKDEYFADGLTEELISKISLVRGLEVIARTSVMCFKKKDMKVSEIGRELKVGTILEGSVRKAGIRIRVSAQLINVNTESHLWAENYDRDLDDIFEVQSSVAEHVASALKLKLLDEDRERIESSGDIEAYTMYLRAIRLYHEDTESSCREAISLFNEAISKDPKFVRAYVGLANAWIGMTGPAEFAACVNRAEAVARKALELGPELAEAHTAMARVYEALDRFDDSRVEMEKAIRISPNLADVNRLLGWSYAVFGRFDEAIICLRKAYALNPLDAVPASYLIMGLRVAGKVDEALDVAEGLKRLHRRNPLLYVRSAHCYLQKKEFAKAMNETDTGLRYNPDHPWLRTTRGVTYALSGRKENAIIELRNLMTDGTESNRMYARVWIGTALGDYDEAFKALMRQAEIHSWWGLIKFDPLFEGLRKDPRFAEFCKKVGLPT